MSMKSMTSKPPKIADPALPGDFISGFEVGRQCGCFDIAALGGTGRVDVYGNQRLGVVDHDAAAGRAGLRYARRPIQSGFRSGSA